MPPVIAFWTPFCPQSILSPPLSKISSNSAISSGTPRTVSSRKNLHSRPCLLSPNLSCLSPMIRSVSTLCLFYQSEPTRTRFRNLVSRHHPSQRADWNSTINSRKCSFPTNLFLQWSFQYFWANQNWQWANNWQVPYTIGSKCILCFCWFFSDSFDECNGHSS